jgi:hypothetical protein
MGGKPLMCVPQASSKEAPVVSVPLKSAPRWVFVFAPQDGAPQVGALQVDIHQVGALQVGVLQDGALQDGASQDGALQDGALQDGVLQECALQEGALQVGALQCHHLTGIAAMPRLSPDEKRARLVQKQNELVAQIQELDARERTKQRKRQTRGKIIAGALVLTHIEQHADDAFAKNLVKFLQKFVAAKDRDLFPFLVKLDAKPETKPDAPKAAYDAAKNEVAAA